MKLSHQDYEHISVLTVSGEFSADDVETFNRSVNDRLTSGTKHFVLDCTHMEFIDSAGLESWLRLQERAGNQGGQLRLVSPDETVSKILELTRLDLAFEAHSSLESAVRSLR